MTSSDRHPWNILSTRGGDPWNTAVQTERLSATDPGPRLVVHRDAGTGEVGLVVIHNRANHIYLTPAEAGELHRHLAAALGLALTSGEFAALVRAFGREAHEASADLTRASGNVRMAWSWLEARPTAAYWLHWIEVRQVVAESTARLAAVRSAYAKLTGS